jgi:hypothetical protein
MHEGEIITKDSLITEWDRVLTFYDDLIQNNFKLRPIRFIVKHIVEKGYNKALFPGTSLYSLLISIPRDNRVNYDKTLMIQYDELTELLKFKFIDKTGLNRQTADRNQYLKWEETCQATEGIALMETFFADNMDFKNIIKEKLTVD